MTIFDEISIIANKLANAGKVPSVALVKSHLKQSVPLPKIIAALKNWHHDPKFVKATHHEESVAPTAELNLNTEAINLLIAQALAPLQQEISELKEQIKILKNNATN